MRSFLFLGAALVLTAPLAAAPVAPPPTYGTYGFDTAGMDRSVTPGNDWGRFANGTYIDHLVIPEDKSSYGMFNVLRDLSQARTRGIVETAAAGDAPAGSELRKIGDYYASFMDAAAIEAKGLAPLAPRLAAIAALRDRESLAATIADLGREGVDVPVNVRLRQDLKNPDVISVYLSQGGLGMPDRDYYLDTKNAKFAEVRGKYQAYIAQMLTLGGVPDAAAKAAAIYALEAKLAAVQWSRVERRQVDKSYNPVATDALPASYRRDAVDAVPDRRRGRHHAAGHRQQPERDRGDGKADRVGAARRMAGVSDVPHAPHLGPAAAGAVRRCALRLLGHRRLRYAGQSGAVEARRRRDRGGTRRSRSARSTSPSISRPRRRPRPTILSATSSRRWMRGWRN